AASSFGTSTRMDFGAGLPASGLIVWLMDARSSCDGNAVPVGAHLCAMLFVTSRKASRTSAPLQRKASGVTVAQLAVAADQGVGGAVVGELRLVGRGQLGDGGLGQLLAQFHAPLVERVDVPDHALHEHAVLVKRDQAAQHARGQAPGEDRAAGPVAGEG